MFVTGLRVNLAKKYGIEAFMQLLYLNKKKLLLVLTLADQTATGNSPKYMDITLQTHLHLVLVSVISLLGV